MVSAPPLSATARKATLLAAFTGLLFSGFQLGLMPLASLSVSRSLMGAAFSDGAAAQWFAWFTAAIMLGAACGGIGLGAIGDRFGRARTLGLSVLLYSIAGGAGALAQTQEQLLVLRFLTGVGVGGMWPCGIALVAESWPGVARPMAAGIAGTGINVGILLVSQIGRVWSVTPETWRTIFAIGALPLLLGAACLVWLPESPAWLAARGVSRQSALGELFRPPLLRITLLGIALGTIPMVGTWASGKWMIPWADKVGGLAHPGLKATTQGWWALGAILGSYAGSHLAHRLGRRAAYFAISLGATVLTSGLFAFFTPLDRAFLPMVFAQGCVSTLFFGWLPYCLPELFPTHVRAAGSGAAYNAGRFLTAGGIFAAGALVAACGGDYARVGTFTGMLYALGMVVVWWMPKSAPRELS